MSTALEQHILEANSRYANAYNSAGLNIQPANKLVISKLHILFGRKASPLTIFFTTVTCMDCRLDPAAAYGFKLGDTTIVRNAGASARDGARSALLTTHVLGAEDIYIIKHTKCGLLGVTTEMAHGIIKKNLGLANSTEDLDNFEVFPIADLEESLKEDVAYLRHHPLAMKKVRVTGWIHDTDTGVLKQVVQ
ncbi:uncharacterized protein BHQ10_006470 [Talaromyces amestolkiae]|uniref:Carbonic anhydrase n=1 Tax=Talaromyces amestolkiae TaxID=1196081 RepID=A0A364L3S2_TALAM|nr:uncharacterized protein BHQ10_006470 [Talaromyces amestolkiae]RAO70458.1 hypothetical protein BHQ10_006470 [Talaromyces amestolkiae]